MRISVPSARHGLITAKFVIAAVTTVLLSGCSDSIDRFSANYNNPSDTDPVYTASVPKYAKPVATHYKRPRAIANYDEQIAEAPIVSKPIYKMKKPAYDYTTAYKQPFKPAAPVYKKPTYAAPVVEEQVAEYAPVAPKYKKPTYKAPQFEEEVVTPVAASPIIKKPALKQAAAASVQVESGMTLYSIARANGVSVQQLAAANNIEAPYTVSMGQVLTIPGGHVAQMPARKVVPLVQEEEQQAAAAPVVKMKAGAAHTVSSGDTLYSLGRQFGVSPFAIADLNNLPHNKALSLGQKLRIPAGGVAQVKAKPEAVAAKEDIADDLTAKPDEQVAVDVPAVKKPMLKQVVDAPADAGALAMRWPVKGKVISGYGAKPNGLKNEGINIAVPEGTSVRAAESGVVAYAGNELKGYGNLVLIRHAGGYVTAYAHASQLMVKRGDAVKRGDVIAKAGQTGAVQSPQLHFEVRKGASALDPYKYLSTSTAMN
jgi:murein DD-endopeptidase MepM/ murein hydrolase activator NlpD